MSDTLNMQGRFTLAGSPGVARRIVRYATEMTEESWTLICEDEDCDHEISEMCWLYDEPEEVEDRSRVVVVMVGDDREEIVDVDDLTEIPEDGYCPGCGQTGCDWR